MARIPANEAVDKARQPGAMQEKIDAHQRGLDVTDIGEEGKGDDEDDGIRQMV